MVRITDCPDMTLLSKKSNISNWLATEANPAQEKYGQDNNILT